MKIHEPSLGLMILIKKNPLFPWILLRIDAATKAPGTCGAFCFLGQWSKPAPNPAQSRATGSRRLQRAATDGV